MLFIPNRTFLIRFGGISGSLIKPRFVFLRDVVERKYPWRDQNEHDVPPKRTKKVRLEIYRTQIRPSEHDIVAILGQ